VISTHEVFVITVSNPPAVISIDVDSLWVVAENMGCTAELDETATYTQAIPEFLRLLDLFSIKATFFCVGKDLSVECNRAIVAEIVRRGHEIGNHTMTHPKNWAELGTNEIIDEIAGCHEVMGNAGVKNVVGFRASGYYLDSRMVSVLREKGYVYDSSVLPSYYMALLMPLGRMLMARSTKVNWPCGQFAYGTAPRFPYFLNERDIFHPAVEGDILEFPIASSSLLRLPFHSTIVFATGLRFFNWAFHTFRQTGLPLVYVFHAVDLLENDKKDFLRNYVTTRILYSRRLEIVESILAKIVKEYRVITGRQLAYETKGALSQ
jgi:hypothetical protein